MHPQDPPLGAPCDGKTSFSGLVRGPMGPGACELSPRVSLLPQPSSPSSGDLSARCCAKYLRALGHHSMMICTSQGTTLKSLPKASQSSSGRTGLNPALEALCHRQGHDITVAPSLASLKGGLVPNPVLCGREQGCEDVSGVEGWESPELGRPAGNPSGGHPGRRKGWQPVVLRSCCGRPSQSHMLRHRLSRWKLAKMGISTPLVSVSATARPSPTSRWVLNIHRPHPAHQMAQASGIFPMAQQMLRWRGPL